MPSAKHVEIERQAEVALMDSVWEGISEHLENERHQVNEEIKNYPPPIAACDAQFNYLLEERARIAQELDRLKALAREGLTRTADLTRISEFIASSNYIKGEREEGMRSILLQLSDKVWGRSAEP